MEYHDTAPAEPDGCDHERFSGALAVLGVADRPLHVIRRTTCRLGQAGRADFGRQRGERPRKVNP